MGTLLLLGAGSTDAQLSPGPTGSANLILYQQACQIEPLALETTTPMQFYVFAY